MHNARLILPLVLVLAAGTAVVLEAAGPGHACRECAACAAGSTTPCGDTGCGPRYRNAAHDEVWRPDPCDACNAWFGCRGQRQMPDLLAPWQLPPGRGFRGPGQVGYSALGPCGSCRPAPWFWPF